jgi:hypothetical protein
VAAESWDARLTEVMKVVEERLAPQQPCNRVAKVNVS